MTPLIANLYQAQLQYFGEWSPLKTYKLVATNGSSSVFLGLGVFYNQICVEHNQALYITNQSVQPTLGLAPDLDSAWDKFAGSGGQVLNYLGTWDAATNTPTLANTANNASGDYYLCIVPGTANFGAGDIIFAINDIVVYSGAVWQNGGAIGIVQTVTSASPTIIVGGTAQNPVLSVQQELTTSSNPTFTGLNLGVTNFAIFDASALSANRTVLIPDANSSTAIQLTEVANNFLTGFNADGTFTRAQPSFSNLSGSILLSQQLTATSLSLGSVKPDNSTITINAEGIISAAQSATGVTDLNSLTGSINIIPGANVAVNPIGNDLEISFAGTGAGVTELNTLTGAVNLIAGTNISVTPVGNDLEISFNGGDTWVSSISSNTLNLSSATGNVIINTSQDLSTTGHVTFDTLRLSSLNPLRLGNLLVQTNLPVPGAIVTLQGDSTTVIPKTNMLGQFVTGINNVGEVLVNQVSFDILDGVILSSQLIPPTSNLIGAVKAGVGIAIAFDGTISAPGSGIAGVSSINGVVGTALISSTNLAISGAGQTIILDMPQALGITDRPQFLGLTLGNIAPDRTVTFITSNIASPINFTFPQSNCVAIVPSSVNNQFVYGVGVDGELIYKQVSFNILSGTIAASQLIAPLNGNIGAVKAGTGVIIDTDGTLNVTGTAGVTSVTSANTDIVITESTTTPVLTLNSGTAADQIVKLNNQASLPAVGGQNLIVTDPTDSTANDLNSTLQNIYNTSGNSNTQVLAGVDLRGIGTITGLYTYTDPNGVSIQLPASDFQANAQLYLIIAPISGFGATNNISFAVDMKMFAGANLLSPLSISFNYTVYGLNTSSNLVTVATGTINSFAFSPHVMSEQSFTTTTGSVGTACSTFFIYINNVSGQTNNTQTIISEIAITPTIS